METTKIVFWSLTLVLSIALILVFKNRKNKKENKTLSVLNNFAKEHGGSISTYDHWGKNFIGLDNSENKKLFFIQTSNEKTSSIAIDLSEVQSCRVAKTETTSAFKKERVRIIEKIELVISFTLPKKQALAIEFYNAEFDALTVSGELLLAKKWSEIIMDILSVQANRKKGGRTVKTQTLPVTSGENEKITAAADHAIKEEHFSSQAV